MFAESACWAVSPLVGMTALLLFPGGHLSRAGAGCCGPMPW